MLPIFPLSLLHSGCSRIDHMILNKAMVPKVGLFVVKTTGACQGPVISNIRAPKIATTHDCNTMTKDFGLCRLVWVSELCQLTLSSSRYRMIEGLTAN